ncbi:immunoglobulin-like domain-containing protein [Yeosuana marina]|uniref:immunoglobulin-like domain-containing protein n=1 Tax=Yeosuana marina TaxID=1565536 RepID=UPI0030EB4B3E
MKKILYIMICIVTVLFSSCDTESTGDVSSVTNFAVFEYTDFTVIPIGGSYTPYAKAFENGSEIEVSITSNLDVNTVGAYIITYSAVNSDGFPAQVSETVIVHDPSIVGTDVTGLIEDAGRPSRTGEITLVPGTTSIFLSSDFGFGGTFPVYFQMDGDTISEIPQTYTFGATQVDLTYDPVTKQFTTLIYPFGYAYTFRYQQ